MANLGHTPGSTDTAPIESRRAEVPKSDPAQPVPEAEAEATSTGLPELGEFAAESARPTPLDEIAEAERENAPRD